MAKKIGRAWNKRAVVAILILLILACVVAAWHFISPIPNRLYVMKFEKPVVKGENPKILLAKQTAIVISPAALAWSPDGRRLVVKSNGKTELLAWGMGDFAYSSGSLTGNFGNSVEFLDNDVVLTSSAFQDRQDGLDASLTIWDSKSRKVHENIDVAPTKSPLGDFRDIFAVDERKKFVAATSLTDARTILIYSVESGSLHHTFTISPRDASTNTSLAFSPDSHYLGVGTSGGTVLLYDPNSGNLVRTIYAYNSSIVSALAFSPGGSRIVTATNNESSTAISKVSSSTQKPNFSQGVGSVRVWRIDNGRFEESYEDPADNSSYSTAVRKISWSSRGIIAFASYDDSVRLWYARNLQTSKPTVILFKGDVLSLAFSLDGSRLAIGHGNEVSIFEIEND
jgi:WD40 repeat protein